MDQINNYEPILVILAFGTLFFLYFTPSFIAFFRGHHQKLPIVLLNFFFGWTFIGWVGSLIWSLMAPNKNVVILNQNPTAKTDISSELSRLHELKEKGVITEAEFLARKEKLLKD